MLLPPGGFLVLGFLLAGKRAAERRLRQRKARLATDGVTPDKAAVA
jgi:hypothetical protein